MRDRPAVVRYYVDADLLGLAKILVRMRPDVTYPGDAGGSIHQRARPPCIVTAPDVADTVWIPQVAAMNWLIITRDRAIQANRAEIDAVRRHAARMVVLSGAEATSTFSQLEVLLCQWRRVEALVDAPGPFIYTATRTAMHRIDLD